MTPLVKTAFRIRTIRKPSGSSIAAALASITAIAMITLGAPAALRIAALIVLLTVPGLAILRLLMGDSRCTAIDPAVLVPLTALLGILGWLAIALAMNSLGLPLRPSTLAVGVGAVAIVLTLVTGLRRRPPRDPRSLHSKAIRATLVLDGIIAVVATVVVVAAAICAASAMITKPVERYTTLGLADDKPYAGETPVVAPGDSVRLNWVLRGFGCTPSPTLTRVRLAVDGMAVDDVAVNLTTAAPDQDSSGTLDGAVTFTAPTITGGHLVELSVLPASDGGTPLPAPGYVSTFIEVEK